MELLKMMPNRKLFLEYSKFFKIFCVHLHLHRNDADILLDCL